MVCISLVPESRQLLALALMPHLLKAPHLVEWHSCSMATVFAKYNTTHAQTSKDENVHQPNQYDGIPSSQRHVANASKNAHCSICVLYCAVADRRQFFCSCKLATQESESACPLSSIVLNIFLLLCLFPDEDLTAQHSSE